MEKYTALVTGGNGIIGQNVAKYLAETGEWNIVVTSNSPLTYRIDADYLQLDLTKKESVLENAAILKTITHVFYASYIQGISLEDQTLTNTLLLKNLILGLESVSAGLRHVTFIQGGKAYGAHLGKTVTPAYETTKRHFPPNFYFDQEDFLRTQSAGKAWNWTALRPDGVIGMAIGNPMNLGVLIAVYAVLCKELSVPMRFPGSEQAYNALFNVTDANLLAKGMEFVSLNPAAGSEIFNITNGDVYRWKTLWPKIAGYFNLEAEEPQSFSLSDLMKDKKPVWDSIIKKYRLKYQDFDQLVQWPFGDFLFNYNFDFFMDVNKLRRAGFNEMNIDTFTSFTNLFDELKAAKVIPE